MNLCTTEYKLWNCYESYATRTGIQIVVTRTAIEQTFERKRQKFLWNVFFLAYGITEISIINERLKITSSSCTNNPGRIFILTVPYFSEVQVGPFVKQSENLFARNISGSNILYHLFFLNLYRNTCDKDKSHIIFMHPPKTNENLEKRGKKMIAVIICYS